MDGKKILGLLVGVVAFAIAYYVAFNGASGLFGGSIESKLQRMATEVNRQLPKQIDSMTRCDKVVAGPGKSYAYHYTISINPTADQQRAVQQATTERVLAASEMKPIFNAGVTVWYKYFDKQGQKVFEFSVQK